jgi:hypothetical protein
MFRSKATEILSKLSNKEIKEVMLFVNSPFHNRNKNIIRLFEALKPFYPDFKDEKCTREHIYKKVYGDKLYNDQVMKNLFSEFYRLLEDYLACVVCSDPDIKNIPLLDRLIVFDDIFLKKYDEIEKSLNNSKIGEDIFFKKFKLLNKKMSYYLLKQKQNKISFDALHKGEYEIIDLLARLPRIISDIRGNESSYYAIDYGFKASEEFFKFFDYEGFINSLAGKHPDYELLKFNFHLFMSLYKKHPEDLDHISEVLKYLKVNSYNFDRNFLFNIFIVLHSAYLSKVSKRIEGAERNLFELHKFHLEINSEIYKNEKQSFRVGDFYTIFSVAKWVSEIEWAEEFVNEYIPYIPSEYRDSLLYYCRASIEFERKEFENALSFANKVNVPDPCYKFSLKILFLMIYYELGYSDQFYSLSETIKKTNISNKWQPSKRIQNNKIFLEIAVKLMKIKLNTDSDPTEIILLRKKIMEFSKIILLPSERWLLEKIDELENKH